MYLLFSTYVYFLFIQENVQILRDLSLLQIQMRDLEGFRVSAVTGIYFTAVWNYSPYIASERWRERISPPSHPPTHTHTPTHTPTHTHTHTYKLHVLSEKKTDQVYTTVILSIRRSGKSPSFASTGHSLPATEVPASPAQLLGGLRPLLSPPQRLSHGSQSHG